MTELKAKIETELFETLEQYAQSCCAEVKQD